MQTLKSWKTHTIPGSVKLTGIFGFVAGLCRLLEIGQLTHENQNRPSDNTLCYRGLRNSLPHSNLVSPREARDRRVNDSLCYRGVRVPSPVSHRKLLSESLKQPANPTLCYRGIRHLKLNSTSV